MSSIAVFGVLRVLFQGCNQRVRSHYLDQLLNFTIHLVEASPASVANIMAKILTLGEEPGRLNALGKIGVGLKILLEAAHAVLHALELGEILIEVELVEELLAAQGEAQHRVDGGVLAARADHPRPVTRDLAAPTPRVERYRRRHHRVFD